MNFNSRNLQSLVQSLTMIGLTSLLSACSDNPAMFQGRLAFSDMSGCPSPVGESQVVSWLDCHAFKRNFDPATGLPFSSFNGPRPDALRPLPGTIKLDVYRGGRDREGLLVSCGSSIQSMTDINGIFNVRVPLKDDDDLCKPGNDHFLVIGTVSLQYRMFSEGNGRMGTTRALWQEEQAYPLLEAEGFGSEFYTGDFGYDVTNPEGGTVHFAVPELTFYATNISVPSSTPGSELPVANLQTRVFLNGTGDDRYGYLRQLLTGYSNVVNLQETARTLLGNSNDYFDKMFVDPPAGTRGWGKSYSVFFDNTWAFGWRGGMALLRPDVEAFEEDGNSDGNPDGSWGAAWLLSSTAVLGHEFGHSMQGGYARYGLPFDYAFAGKMQKPDGEVYDWGHGGWQHAEFGAVMNEGIANSYGQYLLNRCNNAFSAARPLAPLSPFNGGIWSQDTSCDGVDACGYHHTRYHLRDQRGLAEPSAAFTARSTRMANLVAAFIAAGGTQVSSNNEARVGEFGCDLLDNQSTVTHAAAIGTGFRYISDFTYWSHEYLNDSTAATPVARAYSGPALPENVNIPFAELVNAFGNYCPGCDTLPVARGWGSSYNSRRVSISGDMSPQTLGRYLEGLGLINRADLNNVLRTNFMEEVP